MAAEPPQTKGSASLAIEVSGMVWLSRSSANNESMVSMEDDKMKIGDVVVPYLTHKREETQVNPSPNFGRLPLEVHPPK